MRIVIDTNIAFSAILNPSPLYALRSLLIPHTSPLHFCLVTSLQPVTFAKFAPDKSGQAHWANF